MKLFVLCLLVAVVYTSQNSEEKVAKDVEQEVLDAIHSHKVVVYSKTYCPFSKKLKKLLAGYKIPDIKIIELDLHDHMSEMQNFLQGLSGRRTVPQLFLDGKFVGGHDETRAMEDEGILGPLLEKASALLDTHVGNEL